MAPSLAEIKGLIAIWASRYEIIRRIWLFGSLARGHCDDPSDIDLAFELFEDAIDSPTQLWINHVSRWRQELSLSFSLPVHLELMDGLTNNVVNPAVERDGCLLYERKTPA